MNLRNWLRLSRQKNVSNLAQDSNLKLSLKSRLAVEHLEDRTVPAVFLVTNTADMGTGSLRQAILDANATPNVGGPDSIKFNISGSGVHTISPLSQLPDITDPLIVDGYTQAGASPNTNGFGLGDNAVLKIELDGSLAGGGLPGQYINGLNITAGNSTIRGLVINRFDGFGIQLDILGNNTIEGNFIGTDPTGTFAAGNHGTGILLGLNAKSNSNTIGGLSAGARNLISGNGSTNLQINGGDNNLIEGNFIGTDATGTIALSTTVGFYSGIAMGGINNTIGGATSEARNLISGNGGTGIVINADHTIAHNKIQGNYIGTDVTGTLALPNKVGIDDNGSGSDIGGPTATAGTGAGNLISGNTNVGVYGGYGTIQGNLIGTDATGTHIIGNGLGIGAGAELIGGTSAAARNIISGNVTGVGIGSDCIVQGNYIGTDITGTTALANVTGIFVNYTTSDLIGGTADGAGNLISGNSGTGIDIRQGQITVQGNLIGTDVTGNYAVANHTGIYLADSASGNELGGTTPAGRNVISGNVYGIYINGSPNVTGNVVHGNFIGTDITGTHPLGNGIGVAVTSHDNQIGGTLPGEGNVVSGNYTEIWIFGALATGNVVQGNFIGTDWTGSHHLVNTSVPPSDVFGGVEGITIDAAFNNQIGGTTPGAGNTIAFHSQYGVSLVKSGTGNLITRNSIFGNPIGIDLRAR